MVRIGGRCGEGGVMVEGGREMKVGEVWLWF